MSIKVQIEVVLQKKDKIGVTMTEKTRRIIMTTLGVSVCGFAVGLFNFSNFGMDPFQVLAHGVWGLTPLGFGTFYALLNLAMLLVIFFIDRHKIGLGTVINIFLLGYIAEFSDWIWQTLFPDPTIWIKAICLLFGIVIICFGSSLYFVGDLGVSTYDAVALYVSEHTNFRFQYCRITSDVICVVIGFLLGATVGIGTLVTAFFMGPIIALFNRHISKPFRYGKKID